MLSKGRTCLIYKICTLIIGVVCTNVSGIILHTDVQPTVHPVDAVVGRWSYNASCVAISPNYIITTCHQGGGVGSTVNFAGVNYKVAEVAVNGSIDMRVARLETMNGQPANLGVYAPLLTSSTPMTLTPIYVNPGYDDVEEGKTVLLGGFGKSRGTELQYNNKTYGYAWAGTDNLTFRWGANRVENITTSDKYLWADFDGWNKSTAVANEATLAEYDSGGGWFIQDNNDQWVLAALSSGVTDHNNPDSAWFDDPYPTNQGPDELEGLRIKPYADWILANTKTYVVRPGDANWDGVVDVGDLGILAANYGATGKKWQEGDFNADGVVDVGDLGILASHYDGSSEVKGDFDMENALPVPEPATCIFLLIGFAGMLFRLRHSR